MSGSPTVKTTLSQSTYHIGRQLATVAWQQETVYSSTPFSQWQAINN